MGASERAKGVKAEREVRQLLQAGGFTVRGLEGSGDWLAFGKGHVLHVEVKRQETLRLPLWTRQAIAESPPEAVPVVAFRRNREPWSCLVPWPDTEPRSIAHEERILNGGRWLQLSVELLGGILGSPWLPTLPPAPPPAVPASGAGF